MKKILTYVFLSCAVIMNIYLIMYWQPEPSNNTNQEATVAVVAYSKSLCKVDKSKISDCLSDDDKKSLKTTIEKLSAADLENCKKYFKYEDSDEGLVKAFKILRKRLSSEDYDKIKQIVSKIIDINELEKRL